MAIRAPELKAGEQETESSSSSNGGCAHSVLVHELPGGSHSAQYGTFIPEHGRSRWHKLGVVSALLAALVAITALATLTRPAQPSVLSEAAALRLAEEDFEEPQEIAKDRVTSHHAVLSTVPEQHEHVGLARAAPIHAASLAVQLPSPVPPRPALAAAPPSPAAEAPSPSPAHPAATAEAVKPAAPAAHVGLAKEAVEKPEEADAAATARKHEPAAKAVAETNPTHLGALPTTSSLSVGATNHQQAAVAPQGPAPHAGAPARTQERESGGGERVMVTQLAGQSGEEASAAERRAEAKRLLDQAVDGHSFMSFHSILGMQDASQNPAEARTAHATLARAALDAEKAAKVENLATHAPAAVAHAHAPAAGSAQLPAGVNVDSRFFMKQLGSPFADARVRKGDIPGDRPMWDN